MPASASRPPSPSVGAPTALLVLARAGTLYGVDHAAVSGLSRGAAGFRIDLPSGELSADHVVGVARGLAVHALPPVCRRFWPAAARGLCTGMAMYQGTPVVVIDPSSPRELWGLAQGEAVDAEADDGR